MDYFSEESVLNLLYSYNPWWKTGIVQKEFDKPMKRASFFESKKAFDNDEIRRTVLLSGARRTGKTTIMYQTIAELLKNGINPKDIVFIILPQRSGKVKRGVAIMKNLAERICLF